MEGPYSDDRTVGGWSLSCSLLPIAEKRFLASLLRRAKGPPQTAQRPWSNITW